VSLQYREMYVSEWLLQKLGEEDIDVLRHW